MDVSQYLDIFIDETKEHLQNLNDQILSLEQDFPCRSLLKGYGRYHGLQTYAESYP